MTVSLPTFFAQAQVECAVAGMFCHAWIHPLGQKERSTQELQEEASWLAEAGWSRAQAAGWLHGPLGVPFTVGLVKCRVTQLDAFGQPPSVR